MTRLELMMVLYSLEALLGTGKVQEALDLIRKVLAEAESTRDKI